MVWKANWHSDFPDASRPASRPWGLADGVECRWIGSPPPAGGDSVIEGFAPITTGLERGLETSKQKFAETYGLAFERLAKLAGQSLMGLTDALAGRAPGPHLGPLTTERTGNNLRRSDSRPRQGPVRGGPFPRRRRRAVVLAPSRRPPQAHATVDRRQFWAHPARPRRADPQPHARWRASPMARLTCFRVSSSRRVCFSAGCPRGTTNRKASAISARARSAGSSSTTASIAAC